MEGVRVARRWAARIGSTALVVAGLTGSARAGEGNGDPFALYLQVGTTGAGRTANLSYYGGGRGAFLPPRVAMLLGISSFQRPGEFPPLANPVRDVQAMAEYLVSIGFPPENILLPTSVMLAIQTGGTEAFVSQGDVRALMGGVMDKLASLGTERPTLPPLLLVYVASHGFTYGQENYIATSDTRLDVLDRYGEPQGAIALTEFPDRMGLSGGVKVATAISVFDICRAPVAELRTKRSDQAATRGVLYKRKGDFNYLGHVVFSAPRNGSADDGIPGKNGALVTALLPRLAEADVGIYEATRFKFSGAPQVPEYATNDATKGILVPSIKEFARELEFRARQQQSWSSYTPGAGRSPFEITKAIKEDAAALEASYRDLYIGEWARKCTLEDDTCFSK